VLLFVGSWVGQFFFELTEYRDDQAAHGQEFSWSRFWPAFLSSTLENWQSEWLQLIFQAMLLLSAKHLLGMTGRRARTRVGGATMRAGSPLAMFDWTCNGMGHGSQG
jgi:hypothetical protein